MQMDLTINQEVLDSFNDKASKEPETVELYEKHDYITAYGLHTDNRVDADPIWAIGRGDEWDSHGELQRNFLMSIGLRPEHKLLDIGCGVGRAARKLVPYLDPGNYTGCDISHKALNYAINLSTEEGWAKRNPRFVYNSDLDFAERFDFLWAHSVLTHLPEQQIDKMMRNVSRIMKGAFAFTYKLAPCRARRTGLKQFSYSKEFFFDLVEAHGLLAIHLDMRWPAGQRTMVVTHAES